MKNCSAKLKDKSRKGVDVLEFADVSLTNGSSVDRTNALIRGVKVLSKFSDNKHGMPGVSGTTYEPAAHQHLKELLESGIPTNVGHPPKDNPDQERHPRERNGMLMNPQVVNGETFADWQLIPSHELTPSILDCASKDNLRDMYALSINARGYGTIKNGRYCITEFLPTPSSPDKFIRSVDLVTRGGANRNLFESKEVVMQKKPLKDIIAGVLAKPIKNQPKDLEKRWANLLEMYEDMGDTAIDTPEPAEAAADDMDWKAHLGNLLKAIANDPEMPPDQIRAKITAALKCLDEGDEKEGEGGTEDVKEGDEKETEEEKKDAMESREKAELLQLREEKNVRDLCEALEFVPDTKQIAVVAKITNYTDRVRKVNEFKKAKKSSATGPRTASGRDVYESRQQSTPNYDDRSEEARKKRLASLR
jgi:hypothetical protein